MFENTLLRLIYIPFLISISLLTGCSSYDSRIKDNPEAVRQQINLNSKLFIANFLQQKPDFKETLDGSKGYFFGEISSATVVLIGVASGLGVLHDNNNKRQMYLDIKRLELGPGLGVQKLRFLFVFHDTGYMETFKKGRRLPVAGADISAGESSTIANFTLDNKNENYTLVIDTTSGVYAGATARITRIQVNTELTDTGLSKVSRATKGFAEDNQQVEGAPRQWDYALPFLAQKVIDLGYELPNPYGIGYTFAYVEQDQFIEDLKIGFKGSEKIDINSVAFPSVVSKTNTHNLVFDTWIFPFFNLFGMIGKVDGTAPITFTVDGDGALEDLGIRCDGLRPPPICGKLQGGEFSVDIESTISGYNYGIGGTFAAGWNNFFVAIPFTVNFLDLDDKSIDGNAYGIYPRGGYMFDLGSNGALSLFAGASYLYTKLEIEGIQPIPGTEEGIEYSVKQENIDKWTGILGANWDINKNFSLMAEYNGFVGTRKSFIAGLTYRF